MTDRFWSKVDTSGECWIWTAAKRTAGYGAYMPRSRVMVQAHRHAYEITHGPIPLGMIVRHRCDNPPCVRPSHLEVGTTADNSRDAVERGRTARGERHGRHRLTAAQVVEIRERYAAGGVRLLDLSREFGVSQALLSLVVRGRKWAHLGGPRTARNSMHAVNWRAHHGDPTREAA